MTTLGHLVEAVKTRLDHALDHFEDPQETYTLALSRQHEMIGDVRSRLAEVAVERGGASDTQARERLDDEQHRLRELETALRGRIAEFEHLLAVIEHRPSADSTQVTIDHAVAEVERADAESRHCSDW